MACDLHYGDCGNASLIHIRRRAAACRVGGDHLILGKVSMHAVVIQAFGTLNNVGYASNAGRILYEHVYLGIGNRC